MASLVRADRRGSPRARPNRNAAPHPRWMRAGDDAPFFLCLNQPENYSIEAGCVLTFRLRCSMLQRALDRVEGDTLLAD